MVRGLVPDGLPEPVVREIVTLNKAITHWPDALRVTGSLLTERVRSYDLLRTLDRD